MAKTRELPLANYPTGNRTFVKQTPNGLSGFQVEIGRSTTADTTIWPDTATELQITVVPSFDGGATFDPTAKISSGRKKGGIITYPRTSIEVATETFGGGFNPPANAVRIEVEVFNGPLRTFADVVIN